MGIHSVLLVEEMPGMEIRGDHYRLRLEDGQQFAVTMHVMRQFIAKAEQLKREWEGRAEVAVIPICELCVRHNLPRDTH